MLLNINGCRLYAEEMGPRSSGDVVLAFHSPGGSGDSRYVRSTFEGFSDSARVVTFDLRGNGGSEEGLGVPSFENLAADAESLRRTLDLEEVVVAGSSGAGYLALEYALRYPEAVRGLLLWSTAPFHTPLDVLRRNAAALGVALDWDRFDRYWTGNLRDNADLKRASRDFDALRRASGPPPSPPASGKAPGGRYWRYASHNVAMREQSTGWTVEGGLREIEAPTLILHGDKDWIIPLANGTKLRRGIRDSRMEVFQGCGHWLHVEDRPRFEASVRELLLQVRR